LSIRPAIFDRHVPALDVAGFGEALTKSSDELRVRSTISEKPNHRHFRLLRARPERPRDRGAAEQG
jgi:hypothetical protein